MPSAVESVMEDQHRVFLQGLMCRGILNNKEVNTLFEKSLRVCGLEVPEKRKEVTDLLVATIHVINDHLGEVGLGVRKGVDEDSGESFFMLVNTARRVVQGAGRERELGAGVQAQWSREELEYLRLVATEILQSEEKSISSRLALNLTDQVGGAGQQGKRLSMEGAEAAINRLIVAKWLKVLTDGSLGLDVRFLGEMEGWMQEVLPGGVAKCQLCRKVVVRGVYCTCEENVACHRYCIVRQARSGGGQTKCKKCGAVFSGVTAAAASHSQESQDSQEEEGEGSGQSRGERTGKRKNRSGSRGEGSRIAKSMESSGDSE